MPEHETPERKCILSGEHGSRDALIRLAIGPDGEVLPDLGAKAPGRGAWISPDRQLIEQAIAKGRLRGALARAFKGQPLRVPDDLAQRIETGLLRRALDRLGLEMRAGHLILGFDRISDALGSGRAHLILHALDAASDGRAKLDGKARMGRIPSLTIPASRMDLSLALGRENVVHAALDDRAAAARVSAAVERWRAFCGLRDEGTDAGDAPAADDVRV